MTYTRICVEAGPLTDYAELVVRKCLVYGSFTWATLCFKWFSQEIRIYLYRFLFVCNLLKYYRN